MGESPLQNEGGMKLYTLHIVFLTPQFAQKQQKTIVKKPVSTVPEPKIFAPK